MGTEIKITAKGIKFMREYEDHHDIFLDPEGFPYNCDKPEMPAIFTNIPNLPNFAADHPKWEEYMEHMFYWMLITGKWGIGIHHTHSINWTYALFQLGYLSVGE
jgi:hypothetical protein